MNTEELIMLLIKYVKKDYKIPLDMTVGQLVLIIESLKKRG